MFGRDPAPLIEQVQPPEIVDTSVQEWLRKIRNARDLVTNKLQMAQDEAKHYYDQRARPERFKVDDVILLKVEQVPRDKAGKLYPKYVGPYRIRGIQNSVLAVTPLHMPEAEPRYIHSDKARHCQEDFALPADQNTLVRPFLDPAEWDPNLEEEADEDED
jgi:hypothetical protein